MRWFETQVVQTIPNLLASPILLTIGFVWHHWRVLRALDEKFARHERKMKAHVDKATGTQEAGEHDGSDPGDRRGR